ncbi:hypothetical protein HMPREF9016_01295 [Neisseria sp. oral taxon 014 str. F0314]|nr:hypothetical protein HMPREF9016_01295 [Neisseria sp. oral taxon 014 str. F0314]
MGHNYSIIKSFEKLYVQINSEFGNLCKQDAIFRKAGSKKIFFNNALLMYFLFRALGWDVYLQ